MTNAAAISRALKKHAGITTAPRHGRDGFWVANAYPAGTVTLGANFCPLGFGDGVPGWVRRGLASAVEGLTEAGYTVEGFGDDGTLYHVAKKGII